MNGLALEFGRKIRTPESEEVGVVSYTGLYGTKRAVVYWLILLTATLLLAIGAMLYANYGMIGLVIVSIIYVLTTLPALSFIQKPTVKKSKLIELSSVIWTALMYLSLGGIPMLKAMLQ